MNPALPYNQTYALANQSPPGFMYGSLFQDSWPPSSDIASVAATLHANFSELEQLDNEACLKAYRPTVQSFWGNLLIVVGSNTTENWTSTIDYSFQDGVYPMWPCGQNWSIFAATIWTCDISALLRNPAQWSLQTNICDYFHPDGSCKNRHVVDLAVQYCYAQRLSAEEQCLLDVAPGLLLVVIICNILKVFCLSFILLMPQFQPIAIIGDAVSSFLRDRMLLV